MPAHGSHRGCVVGGHREVRGRDPSAFDKQPRCRRVGDRAYVSFATWVRRSGQRLDRKSPLHDQAQQGSAGDKQREARASLDELGKKWGRVGEVLEVVQKQQYLRFAKLGQQQIVSGPPIGLAHIKRAGDGRRYQARVGDGRQVDEHGATLELGRQCCRGG
jgi:hypothetical protein